MKELTLKQQEKARKSIFRRLADIGFKRDEQHDFWWYPIGRKDLRVCVGFAVEDMNFGGRHQHWSWQMAKLNERPKFGYSGTTSSGAAFGTVERILDTTIDQVYSAGFIEGMTQVRESTDGKIKKVRDAVEDLLKNL